MPARLATALFALTLATIGGLPGARAQMTPGGGGFGQPQGPMPDQPSGPAEQADADPDAAPTTPILPPPKSERKRFELIEINGYFRTRTDRHKNFHLGFVDDPLVGGAPFPTSLSCKEGGAEDKPCSSVLSSANMRLRVEPTIHIDEGASVHLQIDVLDNILYGSTPTRGVYTTGVDYRGQDFFRLGDGGQAPPSAGSNHAYDSVRVKRAWAEVETALGLWKFGRQPAHFGMGMLENGGGDDPFHGTYDLDGDFGDTVDRVSFGNIVPGTDYRFAVAMGWGSTVPTAAQTDEYAKRQLAQPWDLDDRDDLNEWVLALTRMDSHQDFSARARSGKVAINYGMQFIYRTQAWDVNPSATLGEEPPPEAFVRRGAKAYIPDLWGRLAFGSMEAEVEATAILGSVDDLVDYGRADGVDVRQFGAVARVFNRWFDDELTLGLEVGYASGDNSPNDPRGEIHVTSASAVSDTNKTLSGFQFNRDFEIDMILFRELMGAVSNATYLRPYLRYDFTETMSFRPQIVGSMANESASTPGNSRFYGVEVDLDLGYESNGFFAGVAYGILFPMAALDHPGDISLGYGTGNIKGAGKAQTFQTRMMLRF